MLRTKSMVLNNPRLSPFTSFIFYAVGCWLFLFIIPVFWVMFVKILNLYYYLTYITYMFFYLSTLCLVILYLALLFQSASFDLKFFLHQPAIEFIEQPYKPKVKIAITYLFKYLSCSYLLLLCFYVAAIFAVGAEMLFLPDEKTIPASNVDFYGQSIIDIVRQQFYRGYIFVRTDFLTNIGISLIVLSILYFLILILGYGGPIFSPLVRVLQRDLWRVTF